MLVLIPNYSNPKQRSFQNKRDNERDESRRRQERTNKREERKKEQQELPLEIRIIEKYCTVTVIIILILLWRLSSVFAFCGGTGIQYDKYQCVVIVTAGGSHTFGLRVT